MQNVYSYMPSPSARLPGLALLVATGAAIAQQPYTLKTHTTEVALTFRAEDEQGRTLTDLAQSDIKLRDNGHTPDKITLFSHHEHLPLHLALLFDISPSMQSLVPPREVANRVAKTAIHDARDQAEVILFDFDTLVEQPWTSEPTLLIAAAAKATAEGRSRLGGTALWDSLYKTCRDNIPAQTPGEETFSSAIILFTDGADNRSHAILQDAVDECQRKQTAIYAFLPDDRTRFDVGQKSLRSLADLTGGRVFYQQLTAANITPSILRLNTDLRDRYTLVYRPADRRRDGRFHTVTIDAPKRTAFFLTRSGYYASKE
jgi:VWFA-related protein